jgi:hypothetical protein
LMKNFRGLKMKFKIFIETKNLFNLKIKGQLVDYI